MMANGCQNSIDLNSLETDGTWGIKAGGPFGLSAFFLVKAHFYTN